MRLQQDLYGITGDEDVYEFGQKLRGKNDNKASWHTSSLYFDNFIGTEEARERNKVWNGRLMA